MPLTNEQIEAVCDRFERERDRYEKLARYIAARADSLLREGAIRYAVQWRVKDVDSLRRKLTAKHAEYASVDDVFGRLSDFAAVRILTYVESDRAAVVALVETSFSGPGGAKDPVIDVKDGSGTKGHYRATHAQVGLSEDEAVGENDNLAGSSCEVQVCSLLAHAWNEIEHDLAYKPTTGEISDGEIRMLDSLGLTVAAGDGVIISLIEANERRFASNEGVFVDRYDFLVRMGPYVEGLDSFDVGAGTVYEELVKRGFTTPQAVASRFLTDGWRGRASAIIERYNVCCGLEALTVVSEMRVGTSDELLALMLPDYAADIRDSYSSPGRGGRKPRQAIIASRYVRFQEGQWPTPQATMD